MALLRPPLAHSNAPDRLLVAATLVLGAYFAARGATQWIAHALPFVPATSAPDTAPRADAPPGHHARDTHAILARDVFDSSAGDLTAPAGLPPPLVRALGDATAALPCPAGASHVVGSVVADGAPSWSFALIAADASQHAQPYRVGDALDGATIASIGWTPSFGAFVVLAPAAASGPRCYRAQRVPEDSAPPAASPPPPSHARPIAVQRTGPHELTIARAELTRLALNPADLARSLRVTPYARGGHTLGVQLGELVPGALAALGLADGDVLERLDGRPLDTPDRWLEVYTRITSGTLDRTVLTVLRGGHETTVDLVVR